MKGFPERRDLAEVQRLLVERVRPLPAESVPTEDAATRVLAEDVVAPRDVPPFARSAVDGYAVRSADTFAAQTLEPVEMRLAGEIMPGRAPPRPIGAGEAMRIMTGAPVPPGADAVVMAEDAREEGDRVLIATALPPGRNVGQRGEDVRAGDVLLRRGRRLRPDDVGVLASVCVREVRVHRRPIAAVLSSGNEVVDPFAPPAAAGEGEPPPGTIFDANGPMLVALAAAEGAIARRRGIVADDVAAVRAALRPGGEDVLLVSGATSVGREDFMPVVLAELGEVWAHGVAMKPGHPVCMGRAGERLVFLLPGNPVAAWVGFHCFVARALRLLQGRPESKLGPERTTRRRLLRKIASEPGRTDFARVRLAGEDGVEPVRVGGAGILTTLTRSDGIVVVPRDREGLEEGESVEVILIS